jgi:hypothetical protein
MYIQYGKTGTIPKKKGGQPLGSATKRDRLPVFIGEMGGFLFLSRLLLLTFLTS